MAKLDRNTAEAEFNKWAEAWDLDFETDMDSKEAQASFDQSKAHMVRAFEKGRLVFDGDVLKFTTTAGNELTFNEPSGAAYMELDGGKEGQNMAKMFKFIANCANTSVNNITGLKGRDIKVCQAFFGLFTNG